MPMELIDRTIDNVILSLAKKYPIIKIIGLKQSRKTTLVQKLFPDKKYINRKNLVQWEFTISASHAFLNIIEDRAILDEIQRTLTIISYLQEVVDTKQIKEHFILTGSYQF
jgi:predicted AAA+ superfamily ATPase